VGIILGVLAKKKLSEVHAPFGMATAGIVTSVIALALSVIITIACFICLGAIGVGLGALIM